MAGREISRDNLVLGDDWGETIPVWGGRTITIDVGSNTAEAQLSSTTPPNPPLWSNPIRLRPGQWSRSRAFGYVRFRNAVKGAVASVSFYAYAEQPDAA